MKKPRMVVILALLAIARVEAHDTWLIPDRFSAPASSNFTLDLTSGMMFPVLDTSILAERVDHAKCRIAGESHVITGFSSGPNSLRMNAPLKAPGIAACWVVLKPKSIDLNPGQVLEYLEEIGAPESIRSPWEAAEKPARWREIYSKYSKTFIRSGDPSSDKSWSDPVGMLLEIVPERDPTGLRAGDELPVRVLRNSKPLAGFSVSLVREGSSKSVMRKTDPLGRATFVVDAAGRWMLRGTYLRETRAPEADWESEFTTLTFETRERD